MLMYSMLTTLRMQRHLPPSLPLALPNKKIWKKKKTYITTLKMCISLKKSSWNQLSNSRSSVRRNHREILKKVCLDKNPGSGEGAEETVASDERWENEWEFSDQRRICVLGEVTARHSNSLSGITTPKAASLSKWFLFLSLPHAN